MLALALAWFFGSPGSFDSAATATAAPPAAVGRAKATVAGLGLPWLGVWPVLWAVLGKGVAWPLLLVAWLWAGGATRGWARGALADAAEAGEAELRRREEARAVAGESRDG